jgi:hypothetical protein
LQEISSEWKEGGAEEGGRREESADGGRKGWRKEKVPASRAVETLEQLYPFQRPLAVAILLIQLFWK